MGWRAQAPERGFRPPGEPLPDEHMPALFDRFIAATVAPIADEPALSRAVGALDALRAGARLAVCQQADGPLQRPVEALSSARLFDAVVGPERPRRKPKPAHLEAAIAAAGARAGAIMVGDAATDVGAARAAGAGLILVSFGYTATPAAELDHDALIDHYDQLPDACLRLLAACGAGPEPL
jgi:phosphoglycolate phosphatase